MLSPDQFHAMRQDIDDHSVISMSIRNEPLNVRVYRGE